MKDERKTFNRTSMESKPIYRRGIYGLPTSLLIEPVWNRNNALTQTSENANSVNF